MSETVTYADAILNGKLASALDGKNMNAGGLYIVRLIRKELEALGYRVVADTPMIDASPDMYEALEVIDDRWTEEFPEGPDTKLPEGFSLSSDTVKIWSRIRAALSKARGDSR